MAEVLHRYPCLQINAPEWYQRTDFLQYLRDTLQRSHPAPGGATWHRGERPSEYSDLFLWFSHRDGSDSDRLPDDVWQQICEICKAEEFHYGVVWIVNLARDTTKEKDHVRPTGL